jgi:lysine 6-dehydrogenase
MSYAYAVVGAGRQGVAAAFDLAVRGDASRVLFLDIDERAAHRAAEQVNALARRRVASGALGDASNEPAMVERLSGTQAILSAAHYNVNLGLTRIAVAIGAHMVDLGGNTGVVRRQHDLDADARRAGITVVPDTGMGPGLNVSLAAYAMGLLDRPREVLIWDGGLPQEPQAPWNYASTFAMSGLTNEYDGSAYFLRDGEVTEVPAFDDLEELRFEPPIGTLEGFVTSGGLSTAPWSWKGTLERLENKTLRYPGHCARFVAYRDLGLLGQAPIDVAGARVIPRDVFHALLEPRLGAGSGPVRDVCVMRVVASGERRAGAARVTIDLVDRYDETTGFTAMQRLTGWHAAICLELAVRGQLEHGVVAVERVPGDLVVAEGRARGWDIRETIS